MISNLRELGLDSYEARAYLALVKIGVSTSTALSAESKVPYGKIYPVLYSLASKGYVTIYEGRPKRFMAVEPRIVLNNELEKKAKLLSKLKDDVSSMINAIEKIEKPQIPMQTIQIIEGKKNYLNMSVKLHRKAKGEYRSISRLPVYKPHLDSYREAAKRGVRARVLTSQKDEGLIKIWKKTGLELRYCEEIDIRYTVVDKTDVVLRIGESDKTGYVSLWIQNPALAVILAKNFDSLWEKSKPV
ncbi:MAG: TrmB family transcriptional regulator [Candidatus Altiarchaeales archaeon]|nr:TrmB family transcriptional regulator [Candidatus Altiarchaeales archaeon]